VHSCAGRGSPDAAVPRPAPKSLPLLADQPVRPHLTKFSPRRPHACRGYELSRDQPEFAAKDVPKLQKNALGPATPRPHPRGASRPHSPGPWPAGYGQGARRASNALPVYEVARRQPASTRPAPLYSRCPIVVEAASLTAGLEACAFAPII